MNGIFQFAFSETGKHLHEKWQQLDQPVLWLWQEAREGQQFHGVDVELVAFLVGGCNDPFHHLYREILHTQQKQIQHNSRSITTTILSKDCHPWLTRTLQIKYVSL